MRVLVCGDREWTDKIMLMHRMASLPEDTIIIEGEARGADSLAREVAEELGFEVIKHKANWTEYGKRAGSIRNSRMLLEEPDLVIAFHDDLENSKGTKDMVAKARRKGVKVEVITH